MRPGSDYTFYTVADARFWLGAVALVNSLRLVGHKEPVVVLDLGTRTSTAASSAFLPSSHR